MKAASFKIVNDTWNFVSYVRIGGTVEEAKKAFDRLVGPSDVKNALTDSTWATFFWAHGKKSHLLWFADNPTCGLLAHEALHAAYHVLREAGVGPLNDDTEEVYTYLVQWIVDGIANGVVKRGIHKRKR